MATQAGPTATPVISDMLERGHEFRFSQVMRLARAWLGPDALERSRVRVRPELSLGFPAADVARVEQTDDDGPDLLVTARFGGLCGVDSPLATFLTEELLEEQSNDRSVVRDFLDIIHQRLYCLYVQCWSKYRTLIRLVDEVDPAELQRAWCLPGMGEREIPGLAPAPFPFLRYGGMFARLTRPVSALEAILKDALGIDAIEIIQCVRRVVPIPEDQQMRLDTGNNILDVDAVLGPDVEDRMGKLVVRAGPLTWEQYNSLLPGTPLYNLLSLLVHLYLPHPLVLELELVLAEGEARPFVLDDPGFRLDFNVFVYDNVMPETGARFPLPSPLVYNSPDEPAPGTSAAEHSACGLVEYFKRELAQFRDLAARFGREHPEPAPMVSGPMADPVVERVLEGAAFLCALLRMKLDDDLPEIIHEVMRNTQPQELSPVPATTIIAFTPKQNCTATHTIPAGTEVASVPIDGTSCRFTTVGPVELHPLALLDASYTRPPGRPALITLQMELKGMRPADWKPETVRLFLSGEYARAADLYLVLARHTRTILVSPLEGGSPAVLEPSCLKPVGFGDGERLLPASAGGAAGFHVIREHSVLPEKFLFLDLTGWDAWRDRGEGKRFEVRFELERPPFPLQKVAREDFTLFATPGVNVFPHKARPIVLQYEDAEYPIMPEGGKNYEVYSIEKVTGIAEGTVERVMFKSSGSISDMHPSYREIRNESLLREGYETAISVKLPRKPDRRHIKSVSVELKCTNGMLPARLGIGDISENTETSLNFATFTNCKPVTRPLFDTLGDNRLWRLFGMQFINLKLLTAGSLNSALKLLYVSTGLDYAMADRNERRIEGIQGLRIEAGDRLIRQVMRRGWNVRITLDPVCFCSPGDMFVFGTVLDHFLRGFVSEAYFSRLVIEDVRGDVEYVWPARMGRKAVV